MEIRIFTDDEDWYQEWKQQIEEAGACALRLEEKELEEPPSYGKAACVLLYLRQEQRRLPLIRRLRRHGFAIMVLVDRENYFEEQQCLAAGAGDYQCAGKPFPVLWQRILLVRRNEEERELPLSWEGRKLTRKEYEVFCCLLKERGLLVSRETLVRQVWGKEAGNSRSIDTIIKQLRHKLKDSGVEIRTHYGRGYSLERKTKKN